MATDLFVLMSAPERFDLRRIGYVTELLVHTKDNVFRRFADFRDFQTNMLLGRGARRT